MIDRPCFSAVIALCLPDIPLKDAKGDYEYGLAELK